MATPRDVSLQMTRNIGIMAHIDAGKTTTTAVSYTHLILGRTATGSILTYLIYGRNRMNDKKRLNSYEDLPLVLDVADIQRIMGISRASAYELVHTPGFPAFRRGRLIKVSKIAFFEWMAKGSETVPRSDK